MTKDVDYWCEKRYFKKRCKHYEDGRCNKFNPEKCKHVFVDVYYVDDEDDYLDLSIDEDYDDEDDPYW